MRNIEKVLATYAARRRSMSQMEICKAAGVSISAVNDVEHGRRAPTGNLLEWLGWQKGYVRMREEENSG
jgi:DNA-binding XRE family transcriptional regulator